MVVHVVASQPSESQTQRYASYGMSMADILHVTGSEDPSVNAKFSSREISTISVTTLQPPLNEYHCIRCHPMHTNAMSDMTVRRHHRRADFVADPAETNGRRAIILYDALVDAVRFESNMRSPIPGSH